MGLPFWQPADCSVQFDIDFVMKRWLIKYLSIYFSIYLGLTLMISSSGESLLRPSTYLQVGLWTWSNYSYSLNSATLDTISGATYSKRLTVNRCRLDSRKYFFSNRIVHHWNNLTQEVVDARSVNVFNRGGFNGRLLVQ